jgi:hypothetical protein
MLCVYLLGRIKVSRRLRYTFMKYFFCIIYITVGNEYKEKRDMPFLTQRIPT